MFHELVTAEAEGRPGFAPAYMMDQSHNVTDPIESLMAVRWRCSAPTPRRCWSTGRRWPAYQDANDALMALATLQHGFRPTSAPILATARLRAGGAIDPIGVYRASGYRAAKDAERPQAAKLGGGIV